MNKRHWQWCAAALLVVAGVGCGGDGPKGLDAGDGGSAGKAKPVKFVGFDANEPLLQALRSGKLQGLVVQNPFQMGRLGVKTAVDALEKRDVTRKISTGETMVTPENIEDKEVASLVDPPKAENRGTPSGVKSGGKSWRVMVIPKGTTHEFWKSIHAGALKAAEELGNVEVIWQGPQKEDDRTLQIQLVQNAAGSGVDAIVLAPLDSRALVEPVEAAIAKGIKAVIIDSGLESDKITSYVATDNYRGGVLAARRLGEVMGGKGRILFLRYMVGSASTDEREKGFTDTIAKEFPNLTYTSDTEYAGATSDAAQQKSQNLVTRFRGQFDGVFCPNESSTLGMLRALEAAGLVLETP